MLNLDIQRADRVMYGMGIEWNAELCRRNVIEAARRGDTVALAVCCVFTALCALRFAL